jgi:hypothetical protein
MKRETLQQWAKRFVADLYVDGEDVSFDGTIRKHIEAILRFRKERLKAKSVLRAITLAGGRREDGQPYSEGQFRIAVSRINREMIGYAAQNARTEPVQPRRKRSAARRSAKPLPATQRAPRDQPSTPPATSQGRLSSTPTARSTLDVSANEITAALSRLKRQK